MSSADVVLPALSTVAQGLLYLKVAMVPRLWLCDKWRMYARSIV